jgi:hypothetical protein
MATTLLSPLGTPAWPALLEPQATACLAAPQAAAVGLAPTRRLLSGRHGVRWREGRREQAHQASGITAPNAPNARGAAPTRSVCCQSPYSPRGVAARVFAVETPVDAPLMRVCCCSRKCMRCSGVLGLSRMPLPR